MILRLLLSTCSARYNSSRVKVISNFKLIKNYSTATGGYRKNCGISNQLFQKYKRPNENIALIIRRFRSGKENIVKLNSGEKAAVKRVKVKLRSGDLKRLIELAKSQKWALTAAIGCLFISSAVTMSVPFTLGKILDTIFNKDGSMERMDESMKRLKTFSLILFGVFVIGGLSNFGRVYLFNSASLHIVRDLRSKLYRRMLNQETGWFDTKGTGELLNRLVNDAHLIGNSLSQNLSDGLRSTVMVTAGFGMMIYTSPKLALLSTCVVPCIAGVAIVYGRYVRTITRDLTDKYAGVSQFAEERLANVKTVKTFCKEYEEASGYDTLLNDAMQLGYKEVTAKSIFFGLTGFAGNVIIISVLYYGGTLVVSEALTIGSLTSFILYAGYSSISLNGLSNFYSELNKGIGAGQRIWEIMDRQYAIPEDTGIHPMTRPRGEILFKNVNFNFPSRPNAKVLKDFNLSLMPGQSTAVVGRSGSGKSTIAILLLRLYDPCLGQILIDGVDLRTINPIWLRSNIGAVSQEPVLFSGTIRENILYGLSAGIKVDEAHFEDIIRKAHVDEFTKLLPQGLDTIVGQRGVMLSGGQKQRVAIARALIKNPAILILDEATSALDSVSEELVQNALEELAKGRTTLTIAHRLSTIRNADKIVVIDQGKICEEGSYEELIAKADGTFMELVRKQAFLTNA